MKAPRGSRRSLLLRAGVVVLALASATLCLAQSTPPPATRLVAIATQVKPDMLNEWLDLQKSEVNPALKKAGISSRTVLATSFGNTYEYVSISPLESFALLDGGSPYARALGPEAAARLTAKLRKCVNGQRTYIINRVSELSIPPDPAAPPLVSVTTRVRVAPGKVEDFENYIKTDLLPVYKKAKAEGKIAGYVVSRRSLGTNALERTQTVYFNKFADLDGGPTLTRMLGQEGAGKLLAKSAGMATLIEQVVRRRVADLSF